MPILIQKFMFSMYQFSYKNLCSVYANFNTKICVKYVPILIQKFVLNMYQF